MDPIGKKLLDVARSELGYTEKADGYTKFGNWYAKNIEDGDSYFKTAPWCDMFLAWAAAKAGVEESVGQFAATIQHARWFKKKDAWGTKPEPGALVFFSWSGSSDIDSIQHVGIVEKVEGDRLITIEANADGVQLKRKTRDMDTVVGFGYPGKVKVASKPATAAQAQAYTPKHAAQTSATADLAKAEALSKAGLSNVNLSGGAPAERSSSPVPHEAALGGVLGIVLIGTVALAVGRSQVARVAAMPAPVRLRKRGRHHRPAAPVTLPADLTPADLDAAEAGTQIMPALTAAAAAAAEDREFWGKIVHLEEDEELCFWDSLHAAAAQPAQVARPAHPWQRAYVERREHMAR